jgi:Holliday junction resolvase-like predicted endonuclease
MKQLGDYGECLAIKYLKKIGYKILDKNYRSNVNHETDFNTDNSVIHETQKDRYVNHETFNHSKIDVIHETTHRPEDKVDEYKYNKIAKLGEFYINKHFPGFECQIDLITIEIQRNRGLIKDNINLSFIENI